MVAVDLYETCFAVVRTYKMPGIYEAILVGIRSLHQSKPKWNRPSPKPNGVDDGSYQRQDEND